MVWARLSKYGSALSFYLKWEFHMSFSHERLYISKEVIERLRSGAFKPVRSNQGDFRLNDRRDRLSPLALTKRAVRYEPYVFLNRVDEVVEAAECLNNPANRIITIYGQSGVGKTAFARAVVEMMGGTPAQIYDRVPYLCLSVAAPKGTARGFLKPY